MYQGARSHTVASASAAGHTAQEARQVSRANCSSAVATLYTVHLRCHRPVSKQTAAPYHDAKGQVPSALTLPQHVHQRIVLLHWPVALLQHVPHIRLAAAAPPPALLYEPVVPAMRPARC
jgi:hypothetical protein